MALTLDTVVDTAITWLAAMRVDLTCGFMAVLPAPHGMLWFSRENLRQHSAHLERILSSALYQVDDGMPLKATAEALEAEYPGNLVRLSLDVLDNRCLFIPVGTLLGAVATLIDRSFYVYDITHIEDRFEHLGDRRAVKVTCDALFLPPQGLSQLVSLSNPGEQIYLPKSWMEQNYPGSIERLKVGLAMGLAGKVLLAYAFLDTPLLPTQSAHSLPVLA